MLHRNSLYFATFMASCAARRQATRLGAKQSKQGIPQRGHPGQLCRISNGRTRPEKWLKWRCQILWADAGDRPWRCQQKGDCGGKRRKDVAPTEPSRKQKADHDKMATAMIWPTRSVFCSSPPSDCPPRSGQAAEARVIGGPLHLVDWPIINHAGPRYCRGTTACGVAVWLARWGRLETASTGHLQVPGLLGTTPFASSRPLTLLDMTPMAATAAFNSPELQPNFFIQYSTSSGSCTFTRDVCSGLKLDSSINAFRPANQSAKQCAANEEKQPSVNYSRPNQPNVHARVRCHVDLQRGGRNKMARNTHRHRASHAVIQTGCDIWCTRSVCAILCETFETLINASRGP